MQSHTNRTPRARRERGLFAACLSTAILLSSSVPALAAGGTLDTTFGAGGITLTNTTGATPSMNDLDSAVALAVQPDGKIVAIGDQTVLASGTGPDFKFMRYLADGSLDETFGTGGIVTVAFTTVSEHPYDLALQSDGKIIGVGYSSITSPVSVLVVRLNPDGALDSSFGNGGIVTLSYAPGVDALAYAVLVQSDGKIVVAGESGGKFGAARLLPDNGALDPSFGSGGKVTATPSSQVTVRAWNATLQTVSGEQRIVLAGQYLKGNNGDFGVMRLRTSGAVDTTFGSSGSVQTDIAGGSDKAFGVAIDAANRIVVAGSVGPVKSGRTGTDFGVVRYTQNGALDATFGTGGKQRSDFAGLDDSPRSVAIQSDGKIVVCGNVKSSSGNDLGIARYDASGTLDITFGFGGRVQLDLFGRSEFASAIVTQTLTNPDGSTRERLLVGGTSDNGAGYNTLVAAFDE